MTITEIKLIKNLSWLIKVAMNSGIKYTNGSNNNDVINAIMCLLGFRALIFIFVPLTFINSSILQNDYSSHNHI